MHAAKTEFAEYYSHVRSDLLDLLTGKDLRILEVGCGTGSTLLYAAQQGIASAVVGVEYVESVAKLARQRGVKKVYSGDFSAAVEKIAKQEKPFDVILFGDVLEHMVDPWQALALAKKLLKNDGKIIASIPNFRYWRVMLNVFFRGDFRYESDGIMDKTHMRFFCRRNILDMVGRDYGILQIISKLPVSVKILTFASFGLLRQFGTLQYIVVAQKKP